MVVGNKNVKIVFLLIPSSKIDRFTSNQDQNYQHPYASCFW